jgi:hypothetical protein
MDTFTGNYQNLDRSEYRQERVTYESETNVLFLHVYFLVQTYRCRQIR